MRKLISTLSFLCCTSMAVLAQSPVKTISGNLNGNVNWSNDTIYLLSGKVYVKAGGTLNIAPGTIVKGDKSVAGSALIITRGAKIYAVGTPTQPIVFTSSETPGNRATADWGGIVIEGNAKINVTGGIGTVEGGNLANPDGTTSDGQYGGLNDLDNSGELKYVRIEYAGFPYAPNNELNSLTLAGVGSGTKLSYIQCSFGYDDSYEFFGGTVNADHLISFRGNDDDFDTDFGYSGKIQFGVAMRDTAVADAVSGSNGFESDNDANGSGNNPYTTAVFSNMTIIGPLHTPTTTINSAFKRGAHIRRNSRESIFNSIFMGWPIGNQIDGDSCHANADNGLLALQNNVIAGCTKNLDSTAGATWNITPWYTATANQNTIYAANTDVMLTAPFNYFAPDFRPSTNSPVLSGASFSHPKLASGFTSVAYKGAFGTDNWATGWTNFNPDTASYLNGYYPVKVKEVTQTLATAVYPNPATETIQVTFTLATGNETTISLYDVSGKLIQEDRKYLQAGTQHVQYHVSNLQAGVYFLVVASGNTKGVNRLTIMQ